MRLDLSFNRLFGSIPKRVADVPLLKVLDVRNNSLSGSVPSGNHTILLFVHFRFWFPFLTIGHDLSMV